MILTILAVSQIITGGPTGCVFPTRPGAIVCEAYCQDDATGAHWPLTMEPGAELVCNDEPKPIGPHFWYQHGRNRFMLPEGNGCPAGPYVCEENRPPHPVLHLVRP